MLTGKDGKRALHMTSLARQAVHHPFAKASISSGHRCSSLHKFWLGMIRTGSPEAQKLEAHAFAITYSQCGSLPSTGCAMHAEQLTSTSYLGAYFLLLNSRCLIVHIVLSPGDISLPAEIAQVVSGNAGLCLRSCLFSSTLALTHRHHDDLGCQDRPADAACFVLVSCCRMEADLQLACSCI